MAEEPVVQKKMLQVMLVGSVAGQERLLDENGAPSAVVRIIVALNHGPYAFHVPLSVAHEFVCGRAVTVSIKPDEEE